MKCHGQLNTHTVYKEEQFWTDKEGHIPASLFPDFSSKVPTSRCFKTLRKKLVWESLICSPKFFVLHMRKLRLRVERSILSLIKGSRGRRTFSLLIPSPDHRYQMSSMSSYQRKTTPSFLHRLPLSLKG